MCWQNKLADFGYRAVSTTAALTTFVGIGVCLQNLANVHFQVNEIEYKRKLDEEAMRTAQFDDGTAQPDGASEDGAS